MQEKELLQHLVNTSNSLSEILRKQGKAKSGANFKILKDKLESYNIKYHFISIKSLFEKIPLKDKLIKGSNIQSSKLKRELIEAGLKENKCEICGQLPEWNGKQLVLQLDHINGDHYDNRLENLRIVCPNCHTHTETFGYKRPNTTCVDCGEEIGSKSTRCKKCCAVHNKQTQSNPNKPSKEELLNLIKEKSFVEIGKMFKVSDNNIRKWCKRYGLPYTKKEVYALMQNNKNNITNQ